MGLILTQELIPIHEECKVELVKKTITIQGPNGKVTKDFSHIVMTADIVDNNIRLRLWNGKRRENAKITTCASLIKNMFLGVTQGFSYTLKAAYKHFPISFEIEDNAKTLIIKNFLGEKNTRKFEMRGDSVVKASSEKDTFVIEGINLEDVSQSAGTIQNAMRPKNRDTRIFLDGVYITRKCLIGEI